MKHAHPAGEHLWVLGADPEVHGAVLYLLRDHEGEPPRTLNYEAPSGRLYILRRREPQRRRMDDGPPMLVYYVAAVVTGTD
jgi:hypothetical protein